VLRSITRTLPRLALIGTLAAVAALSACGRKGPLELPPAAQVPAAPAQAGPAAPATLLEGASPLTPEDATVLAPPGAPRRLPLDWLID
jgi:predicted small lipoprotein YifL